MMSTAARFQLSLVGELSPMVTVWPWLLVVVCRWAHEVSPALVSRYWLTTVWPEPAAREIALSQSWPTAQTSDPEVEATSDTFGAPDDAFAVATGPGAAADPLK